ncbi:hypothetical protein DPMN_022286 [Dreissena polymorpha]|uniref:Uncharacterized protein n=1 Tax=Dreissena polymorpha TaxID=45954 RepID=A0A9D4NK41_DREPO|nr:hypothetical protein DPMN_022286 [Dreissena polymorpha]
MVSGLKASEVFLEKLKCRKCGYQGYYEQQYQDHIATHTEDILKCKCCKFVTFEKDDLIVHFKVGQICNGGPGMGLR